MITMKTVMATTPEAQVQRPTLLRELLTELFAMALNNRRPSQFAPSVEIGLGRLSSALPTLLAPTPQHR